MRIALAAALAFVPLLSAAAGLPVVAHQNGILVEDGYATAAGASAPTGAVYMRITNEGSREDRLLEVRTDAAARALLHASEVSDGVSRMRPLRDGIAVPAGQTVLLDPGGSHVMLMGLTAPLADGGSVPMTLVFAVAGEIPITVPVDLEAIGSNGDVDAPAGP